MAASHVMTEIESIESDDSVVAAEDRTQTLEIDASAPTAGWILEVGSVHGVQNFPLAPKERTTLGSGRAAPLRIADAAVSSAHCRIEATEHGVFVEDLCSRNGLWVGGARVERAMLRGSGTSFVVGRTTVLVRHELADDAAIVAEGVEAVPGIIGSSPPMRRLLRDIRRYAALRGPVLLQGESGTGKDVVARALHLLGKRQGNYVPINVGAIAESLADAELFGHQRGAFTGAVASRAGAFEQAHRGTLLLDEIAELSPSLQVKLLRVVEDGQVRPVGAVDSMRVDVRIISATWAKLAERVRAGAFRADLYHRLTTFVLELPPLRDRKSDIPALARALLIRMRDEVGNKRLSSSALARLVVHPWPGNVRELASVLYRASVLSDAEEIGARHVELALPPRDRDKPGQLSPEQAISLLRQFGGNISAAARSARVARSTFRGWVDKGRMRRGTIAR